MVAPNFGATIFCLYNPCHYLKRLNLVQNL